MLGRLRVNRCSNTTDTAMARPTSQCVRATTMTHLGGRRMVARDEFDYFAAATAAAKALAFAVIAAQFFSLKAFASTSELPAAVANDPAFRNSPTLFSFTPPVGTTSTCGSGALTALM